MSRRAHSEGRLRAALFVLPLLALLPAPARADEAISLRLISWQDEGALPLRAIPDLIATFQTRLPQVRLSYNHEPWSEARVRLRYWRGSHRRYAPDLTVLPDTWLSDCVADLLPLDDRLKPEDIAGFMPGVLERCRVGGRLVGVPWMVRSRALYYRSDLMEAAKLKPPGTLSELETVAVAVAKPPELWGLGLPGANAGGALETFLDLLSAQGGSALDADGKLDLQTDEAEAALGTWVRLRQAGALQPEVLCWAQDELETAFAQGRLGMLIAGPELHQRLRQEAPDLKFATAALPADHAASLPLTAQVLVVLASTPHPAEAAEFAQFMATAESQRAMTFMGGLPTYRKQVEAVREAPDVGTFLAGMEQARGLPMVDTQRAAAIVERAVVLAVSGKLTAAEALKVASEEAEGP